jgi:TonB family protein
MRTNQKASQLCALFLCMLCTISSPSFSSPQQTDPFYLALIEKAQKAFLAKNYQDAVRGFEIAVFGLTQDKTLRAKACIYLGLSYYYLKDIKACEKNFREAADLVGEEGFKDLKISEEVRPDVEKLLAYFDIRQNTAESPLQAGDKQAESIAPTKEIPAEKQPEKLDESPVMPGDMSLDSVKEGGLVPLELVDAPPLVIKQVEAVYPAWARSHKIEGTVVVNALVSEKGSVTKTAVLQGMKGAFGFNQSAEIAVRQWKFEPATVNGLKVKVWMPIAIEFKLKESS